MTKRRVTWFSVILLTLMIFSGAAIAQTCSAIALDCSATATVTAPPGGSCIAEDQCCFALAVAFDANGNIVQQQIRHCWNCAYFCLII